MRGCILRHEYSILSPFLPESMFFYSLPLLFKTVGLLSPAEALFIAAGIFVLLWLTAPSPDGIFRSWRKDSYLLNCWLGEQPLLAAFWPFFLILNGALFGVDWLVRTGNFTVSSWDDVHFVLLFPVLWWTVSIWRCSAHVSIRAWSAGARFLGMSVFVEYGLKLYLRTEYPRLFFACEESLLDFGSCF